MAYIPETGIGTGNAILAEHILRIIQALNGIATVDIKILGKLEIVDGNLYINTIQVLADATELNGLANRTAGTNEANKPIIVGAVKDVDYLRIEQCSVGELIEDNPSLGTPMGKIIAYEKFI